jgi:hypothetical protein
MRLFLILALLLPQFACGSGAGDGLYRAQFDTELESVTVEACFDGPAPYRLFRHEKAGRYTLWMKSGQRDIPARTDGSRLDLPTLPPDSCISWQVDLEAAAEAGDWRLAARPLVLA